jgi:hypothetical protein
MAAHGGVAGKDGMASKTETAHYIADMILELRNLAKGSGMSTLQGLLEIAYYEASSVASRVVIPQEEVEHLYEIGADARKANVA